MMLTSLERILSRSFYPISFRKRNEVSFPCPKCSHKDFRFNLKKRVGYCFRASCHWTPSLSDLEPYFRYGLRGSLELSEERYLSKGMEVAPPQEIFLPGEVLVFQKDGKLLTRNKRIMEEIKKRGVSPEDQYKFGLTSDLGRIYIPVFEGGDLVNYVGRAFWWVAFASPLRYTYAKGIKTSDYFLNWDLASKWERLTLVENSFNGIWLQKYNCTSNFGSTLSETQIKKILHGNSKSVVLLWDEGAEESAERAVGKLLDLGIPSCYIRIKGQPDDHSEEFISKTIYEGHEAARTGRKVL